MKTLITNISSLVTPEASGKKFLAGADMGKLTEISDAAIYFDSKILWLGSTAEALAMMSTGKTDPEQIFSARGKTILPGFCDSHTHIIFAGNRSAEFGKRLRGATYQQIAEEGGGILHTVSATRRASEEDLYDSAKKIAWSAIRHGTTAIEIKSGYGLDTQTELKMLRVAKMLKEDLPVHVSTTFLGAHDFPPEYRSRPDAYIDLICNEMIPLIAKEELADYCDAFVDKGYYTSVQAERIFRTALDHGMKIRVHADELASVGAAELAGMMGAVSADHLLYVSDAGIDALRNAGTIATLLPGTAYFIRLPYAPARKIIEKGAALALASDCNPGSCFTENMQTILSLAVINMQITAEEAITAATLNGAAAMGQSHRFGSLEPGMDANFLIAGVESYIDLFYHFGINHVKEVWVNGRKIV